MISNLPLNVRAESATIPTSDTVHQERHDCGRLLIVVKKDGIELACPKCGGKELYTWRKILTMQLMAWT